MPLKRVNERKNFSSDCYQLLNESVSFNKEEKIVLDWKSSWEHNQILVMVLDEILM